MTSPKNWLGIFKAFISEVRIQSKEVMAEDERGSRLDLWESQERVLRAVAAGLQDDRRMLLILKSRQLGCTTVSLALDVFYMAMFPGLIGALVVDREENRDKFREMLKNYVLSMPDEYRGDSFQIESNNDKFMSFTNKSRIDFLVAGTKKKVGWGESQGYAYVHMTEIAKYGDAEELSNFMSSLAQENPHRFFLLESTARGNNHWKDMWLDAGRDQFNKQRLFIGWWSKPTNILREGDRRFIAYGTNPPNEEELDKIQQVQERYGWTVTREQLAWYRMMAADTSRSDQSIRQNEPWTEEEAFVLSGFSYFPMKRLQEDLDRLQGPDAPLFQGYRYILGNDWKYVQLEAIRDQYRIDEVELRIWEEPKPSGVYAISCDPAFGRNDWKDRHAIEVWRCYADRMVQVAEWASSDCDTRQATWVLAHLGGIYRDCMVSVELTGGPGRLIMAELDILRERVRSEFYRSENNQLISERGWEDFHSNARWYLYHRPDSMGAGYLYNFDTNARSKFVIMNRFRDYYYQDTLEIRSLRLVEEMVTVVQDGSHIGAPDGTGDSNKDDRVFATALSINTWAEWLRRELEARGATFQMISSQEQGLVNAAASQVNGIVFRFLKRQVAEAAAAAEEEAMQQPWLSDRGLVEPGPEAAGSAAWMGRKGLDA